MVKTIERFTFDLPGEHAQVTVRVKKGQTPKEAKDNFLERLHYGRKGMIIPGRKGQL